MGSALLSDCPRFNSSQQQFVTMLQSRIFNFFHLKSYLPSHNILSRNNKFTGQISDDKVATRMRDDEREVQNGGEKMDNPPPYNWINRRFVARPGSQLLFTRCRYPPCGGTMMYVPRDLYLLRGYIK